MQPAIPSKPSLQENPLGGRTRDYAAREELRRQFDDRLVVRPDLNRRLVSYQANKAHPGLRWFKYREGFSSEFVQSALQLSDGPVLDPFAGIGTTVHVAGGHQRPSTGVEIMPVGVRAARAISSVAHNTDMQAFERSGRELLRALEARKPDPVYRFPHVPITQNAFPPGTEDEIANARAFLDTLCVGETRSILEVACISVLEEVSYTRKDGQYLRWDERSGRPLRGGMNKGPIPGFKDSLDRRLREIRHDAHLLAELFCGRPARIIEGSALRELPMLPDDSVGLTITSPPYANRYDYTRTYALELAWLGYDRAKFGDLRQSLISATVENRSKQTQLDEEYPRPDTLARSRAAIEDQFALHEVLNALRARKTELSNPHVIRLIENYFSEMSIIVAELARVTRAGGRVVMVNDNVQYHGEEVPVDLILSNIAEMSGFVCEEIGVLPKGKGNASQQMGRFGRRELRKCVYVWRMEQ